MAGAGVTIKLYKILNRVEKINRNNYVQSPTILELGDIERNY